MSVKKETPLSNAVFWAARKGNLALLQLLLNSGRVDADCRDSVRTLHVLAAQLHALTIDRVRDDSADGGVVQRPL
ncbi:unnamed protein product [Pleuronectes platessa]|uniref:Uncharacterized protein n=1 Tax=Pleuronectes platessa TaxID=8262 RepID=A0A9N7Y290_PLEPL|nr:unnamed protein product [Pleuronectes platessa]